MDRYNNAKNRFLFYPWGVWITAYARRNLFMGMLEMGSDYIYSDTDSLKIENMESHKEYFEKYNDEIHSKLRKVAEVHKIEIEELYPKTIKGVTKPVGVWEYEGTYSKFKTLGAKRYMYDDNGLHITVAGLSKTKGAEYLATFNDPFEEFKIGLKVPKENSGRTTATYIDYETAGTAVDYLGNKGEYHDMSSVHVENSTYEMSISPEFDMFLDMIQNITTEED